MDVPFLGRIETALDGILPQTSEEPSVLHEAMRYAVGTGGKRIRPVVCLASCLAAGGGIDDAICPACAIELLHNYTLVHDDLPAMDNDVERRGKPTVWKKYGEANAILVADALQALAFGTAAKAPRNAAAIVAELAEKGVGVVRGQVVDIVRDVARRDFIYEHKTADLFIAAARMGALAAGAEAEVVSRLGSFALDLGLAFQLEDDLLDGDGLYGNETAGRVRDCTDRAIASLEGLPGDVSVLRALTAKLVGRKA